MRRQRGHALRVGPLLLSATLASLLVSSGALAANRAPVDEIKVEPGQSQNEVQPASQQHAEMYYQMQVLQDEVRQLRGLMEEMAHELKQLKQRQMDDYLDLDRRVSGLHSGDTVTAASQGASGTQSTPSVLSGGALPISADGEKDNYSAAYQLLRDKQVKQAAQAFQKHIDMYPNGKYIANAYYWLGEIHVLNSELEQARQSFAMVVNNYPTSRKAPDAAFKLGKVYHLLGDNAKARDLLKKVAAGNSKAARLAQQYLATELQ